MGGPKKKEAEAIIVDKWPRPAEFRSWIISFKSEVCHSSQYPSLYEDVKSIDELITSASIRLDFKIARGLKKILTGNFKKQVTTAESKAQAEKR